MKRDQFLRVDSMKEREEEVRGHLKSGEKSGGVGQPPMWRGGDQPGHVQGQDQKRRQVVCSSGRWNGSGRTRDWLSFSLGLKGSGTQAGEDPHHSQQDQTCRPQKVLGLGVVPQ